MNLASFSTHHEALARVFSFFFLSFFHVWRNRVWRWDECGASLRWVPWKVVGLEVSVVFNTLCIYLDPCYYSKVCSKWVKSAWWAFGKHRLEARLEFPTPESKSGTGKKASNFQERGGKEGRRQATSWVKPGPPFVCWYGPRSQSTIVGCCLVQHLGVSKAMTNRELKSAPTNATNVDMISDKFLQKL